MTAYWDILDGGSLAVWTYDQDPEADNPAQTMQSDGFSWSSGANVRSFPNEVFDLLWDAAVAHYNGPANGTVDFKLVRIIAEAAFEQIERR